MKFIFESRRARANSILVGLLVVVAWPASAIDLSTQVDVASDRLFRGLTQNNGLSASGRADLAFDRHIYAGAFVGNNRLAGDAQLDAYAGYRQSFLFHDLIAWNADAGVSTSVFTGDVHGPRGQNLDYVEAYAGAALGPVSAKAYFSPDYYNLGASAWRLNGSLRLPIAPGLQFTGTLAWNDGDGVRRLTAARTANGRGHAYADYSATLRQDLPFGFSAYAQLGGTSLDIDGRRWPRVLVGISKRFDF